MRSLPLLLLFVVPTILPAQGESKSWLSLSRLSLSLGGAFAFAPWGQFNDAYQNLRDAIGYSTFYPSPEGHIRKIRGDVMFRFSGRYRISGGLSAVLFGEYGGTSSELLLKQYYGETIYGPNPPIEGTTHTWQHTFEFRARTVGAGLDYAFDVIPPVRGHIFARAGFAKGSLDITYSDELERVTKERFVFPLTDHGILLAAGYGFSTPLWGPLDVEATIEYRALRFTDMHGTGTYTRDEPYINYHYEQSIDAFLASGGTYYGVKTTNSFPDGYYLYRLWTESGMTNIPALSKATLDLSGISVQAQLVFQF